MNTTELPVFVGITGHRDLIEPEKVKEQLVVFFRQLREAMPDTKFCLVSGFAAGADQIFVETGKMILKERAETFAVLPFSRSEYQKDFSEAELPAFQKLLDSADYTTDLRGSRENGSKAYSAVGDFLVEHVNILVSVWDGNIPVPQDGERREGGTWDVSDHWMNYERKHPESLFSSFRIPSLVWIPAERIPDPLRICEPYPGKKLEADKHRNRVRFDASLDAKEFLSHYFKKRKADHALEQINAYNRLCREERPGRMKSREELGISNTQGVEKAIERYAVLDDEAKTTQKRYGKQFIWIFGLSFLLGVCAQIYGGVDHEFLSFDLFSIHFRPVTWSLVAYLVLLIIVFIFVSTVKIMGVNNKYLDYRALAELLRIIVFWKIAGIEDHVTDFFLCQTPERLEWIVIALKNWSLLDQNAPDRKECINDTDVVKKTWVENQLGYYSRNAERCRTKAGRTRRFAYFGFGISLFCGIYFFVLTFLLSRPLQTIPLYSWNGFLVGFGSFFMAALFFCLEKKGWEETAESYSSMAKLFGTVGKCLEQMPGEETSRYLAYLGRAAIREHEEWLIQQRKRKPEPMI